MKDSNLDAPGGVDERPSALLTPEERYNRIAAAAYLRAAARGFVGGDSMQDWPAAEAELMNSGDQGSTRIRNLVGSTRMLIVRQASRSDP